MKKIIYLLIIITLSCKKDKPPVRPIANNNAVIKDTTNRLLITNEGTFNFNNASISLINPTQKSIIQDVYKYINNQPLGDVLQSLTIYNDKIFAVVNNSSKIEVLDKVTFKKINTITGLNSPRYLLPINTNTAYVSDLYANAVTIINLNTFTKAGQISCKGWTEQMLLSNNNVYVCNYNSNYLYVINTSTNQITDSILISKGAQSITQDNNGLLWIGCLSDEYNNYYGAIYVINPNTKQITQSYTPNTYNFSPADIRFYSETKQVYYRNKGLNAIDVNSYNFPGVLKINFGNKNIYGYELDLKKQTAYFCDAKDFVQTGLLRIANLTTGNFTDSILVGINPSHIYFLDR